ncbi:SPOR domain-containing protein [Stakelama sp. CBK3Z-3]|uniref:SPOR domain-containing protein n=1 Tax=Stakelama flava TaxID=2860338 RepID=A0ABS6XL82_9SPHN|nr:SPOR domain-containing protein [Stakelama flava]MBW4330957.1 SPOR domain-containing protein [Stakelama flava]
MKSHNSLILAVLPLLAGACADTRYGRYDPTPVAGDYPAPPPRGAEDEGYPPQSDGYDRAGPGAGYPVPGDEPGPDRARPMPAQQQDMRPPEGGSGPRGSSRAAPGEDRYDEVGYAISTTDAAGFGPNVMYAASRVLPPESFVEITSLNTGRIVLAKIAARGPRDGNALIDLAPALASALDMGGDPLPVRVRKVVPTSQDQAMINAGQAAPPRIDAPQSMLRVLSRQLPPTPARTSAPATVQATHPAPAASPAPIRRSGQSQPMRAVVSGTSYPEPDGAPGSTLGGNRNYYVQIVTLSYPDKARTFANRVHGYVVPGGGLYRVRVGPYATRAMADQARRAAASEGFSDARIYDTAR